MNVAAGRYVTERKGEMNRRVPLRTSWMLFCFSLILMTHSVSADAQTPQQIAKKAFPSVVLLVMEDANKQPMSLGSGFLVGSTIEGIVASNLHVTKGAFQGYAKLFDQDVKFYIDGTVGIDSEHDLVLLKISHQHIEDKTSERFIRLGPLDEDLLPLGNSDNVEVGEPVYAIGNPLGLEGTFSQGIVSSIRRVGKDKLLQITAPISPGSSGGPVLNSKGEVIGVSVATFQGGQNLNFAIPSKYLKALIAKAGPAKPLKAARSSAEQRSISAGLGGRNTKGVIGGYLTWTICGNCGNYSFSLRNQLRDNVRNVYCLVVFYDSQGIPIDVDVVQYFGVIPAGLAKRVTSKVDGSVQELITAQGSKTPRARVEFRILDFQIVD